MFVYRRFLKKEKKYSPSYSSPTTHLSYKKATTHTSKKPTTYRSSTKDDRHLPSSHKASSHRKKTQHVPASMPDNRSLSFVQRDEAKISEIAELPGSPDRESILLPDIEHFPLVTPLPEPSHAKRILVELPGSPPDRKSVRTVLRKDIYFPPVTPPPEVSERAKQRKPTFVSEDRRPPLPPRPVSSHPFTWEYMEDLHQHAVELSTSLYTQLSRDKHLVMGRHKPFTDFTTGLTFTPF